MTNSVETVVRALKVLLAGSVPCWGFCGGREAGVLILRDGVAVVRWRYFVRCPMTWKISTAALVFAAAPLFAQTSGVSHPDSAVIQSDDETPVVKPLTPRPSAAVPSATAAPSQTEVYGPYV